jgi:hypothetical protein
MEVGEVGGHLFSVLAAAKVRNRFRASFAKKRAKIERHIDCLSSRST